ncbi:MAG: 4-hydroxy-tetrahydrodipicolinate reductase [Omnitrophica bacterium RBG_13_46_9]|nr:MAG: 4-hydroxy-tetrahydrodipicolinate reductase [Omnitrophica bacterium RBG_13_46_9]
MVKIIVSGASGRMGKRIIELAQNDGDIEVIGGIELKPVPEANIASDISRIKGAYNCIIEFTAPKATVEHVEAATRLKKAMVIGTTGLSEDDMGVVKKASAVIPIVLSPNMSIGVNLLFCLIERAVKTLGGEYKVRIREAHHIHKKDKPSGTAMLMSNIVRENAKDVDVPIESIRDGEIIGDHDMVFESTVDILRISHSAKTRDIFALGALKAAKFVITKRNGLYSMSDVLGLN